MSTAIKICALFFLTFLLDRGSLAIAQPGGGPGSALNCASCVIADTPTSCQAQIVLPPLCNVTPCVVTYVFGTPNYGCEKPTQQTFVEDTVMRTVREVAFNEPGYSCFQTNLKHCTYVWACNCQRDDANKVLPDLPCQAVGIPSTGPSNYADVIISGPACNM